MVIIVDSSVIIAVIAGEPEKDAILKLTAGVDLMAPDSLRWEIGNAFSAMLKRKRIILEDAQKALEICNRIPITPLEVDFKRSLEISAQWNIYAYDAYILYCCAHYHHPLLSLDRQLIYLAGRMKLKVLEV